MFERFVANVQLMTSAAKELSVRRKEANLFAAIIESKLEDIVDQFYLSAGPKSRISAPEAQERLAVLDDLEYAIHRTKKLRAAILDQPTDLVLNVPELGLLHEVTAKMRLRYCEGMQATDLKVQQHGESILRICSADGAPPGNGDAGGTLRELEGMFGCLLDAVRASSSRPPADGPERWRPSDPLGRAPEGEEGALEADEGAPETDEGEGGARSPEASNRPQRSAGDGGAMDAEQAVSIPWTVDMATSPLQVLDAIQEHCASCDIINYLGETECHSLSSVARSILYSHPWDSEGGASTCEVRCSAAECTPFGNRASMGCEQDPAILPRWGETRRHRTFSSPPIPFLPSV